MKFYDGKKAEDNIIEYIKERNNNFYEIKYLNQDYAELRNVVNIDKDREEMSMQAIERDKELYKRYRYYCIRDLVCYLSDLAALAIAFRGSRQLFACVFFVFGYYFFNELMKDKDKYFELKKYRKFLSIRDELKKEENKNILDVIEFEKIYQDPRGIIIDNLDNYSLTDISLIKKELKRRNKSNV